MPNARIRASSDSAVPHGEVAFCSSVRRPLRRSCIVNIGGVPMAALGHPSVWTMSAFCAVLSLVQCAANDHTPPDFRNALGHSRQFERSFCQFRFIRVHTACGRVNTGKPRRRRAQIGVPPVPLLVNPNRLFHCTFDWTSAPQEV